MADAEHKGNTAGGSDVVVSWTPDCGALHVETNPRQISNVCPDGLSGWSEYRQVGWLLDYGPDSDNPPRFEEFKWNNRCVPVYVKVEG